MADNPQPPISLGGLAGTRRFKPPGQGGFRPNPVTSPKPPLSDFDRLLAIGKAWPGTATPGEQASIQFLLNQDPAFTLDLLTETVLAAPDTVERYIELEDRGLGGGSGSPTAPPPESDLQRMLRTGIAPPGSSIRPPESDLQRMLRTGIAPPGSSIRQDDPMLSARSTSATKVDLGIPQAGSGIAPRIEVDDWTPSNGDRVHGVPELLLELDKQVNVLTGGEDETISARVGRPGGGRVAQTIAGALDKVDPGHTLRAVANSPINRLPCVPASYARAIAKRLRACR